MAENPIDLNPPSYIARLRARRKLLHQMEMSDQDYIDALRFIKAEMLAREISCSFKPRGIAFISQCIAWLKTGQYVKPKPFVVPSSKLDLYPDK